MNKQMKEIVDILMRRDGISEKEAVEEYRRTQSELLDAIVGTSCLEPEDVLAEELGLEPDYIFNFL